MDNTDMFWDDVYNDDMDVPRWDEDNVMNNKASDKNYVKLSTTQRKGEKMKYCKKCGQLAILNKNKKYYCPKCSESYIYDTLSDDMIVERKPSESIEEKLNNAINVMRQLGELINSLAIESGIDISDEGQLNEGMKESINFLEKLYTIINASMVLAVYAGEAWRQDSINGDNFKWGYGADGYEFLDKYLTIGQEISDLFGTTDYCNSFYDYFCTYILPKK